MNEDHLSKQCDIIIYRKDKGAVVYSIGDLKIIDASSVLVVVEVKSSINKQSFYTTLEAYKSLSKLGVNNYYLFIYGSISRKSIQRWFLQYNFTKDKKSEREKIDYESYDWPDKEWLPNAILSLTSCNYFKLDHLQDDKNDWVGYASYKIKDKRDKEVSCLQEFFATVMELFNFSFKIDIKDYSIREGFLLFQM